MSCWAPVTPGDDLVPVVQAVMQQMLLSGSESLDSMNLMRFMSLFAVALLVPLAIATEGPSAFVDTVTANMLQVRRAQGSTAMRGASGE